MTVIKQLELTAFGKFTNHTVTLFDGINEFIYQNEWGKSTLCDFVLFMLYGIKATSKKSITLDENHLEKYLPWSDGSRIAGAMELVSDGVSYRIERSVTAKGSGKIKVYRGGTECDMKEPGIGLFGVDKQTFMRTFLVRQTDIRFDKTADIETALVNLVTTGDEDVSFDSAVKRLDDLQRPIQSQKQSNTGKIPALRREIMSLEDALRTLKFKKEEYDVRLSQLDTLVTSLDSAKKQLASITAAEEVARANDAAALVSRIDALDKSIDECRDRIGSALRPLTESEKSYMTDTFNSYALADNALSKDKEKQSELLDRIALEKSEFPDYDLFDENTGQITALVDKKPSPSIPLMITGFIVTAVGVVAGLAVMPALFAVAAVGILLALLSVTVVKNAVKIPPEYAPSQDALVKKLERFRECEQKITRLKVESELYKKRVDDGQKVIEKLQSSLDKIRLDYGIDSKDAFDRRIVSEKMGAEQQSTLAQLQKQREMLLDGNDEAELRTVARGADNSDLTFSFVTDKKVQLTSFINERTTQISALEGSRIAREDTLRAVYETEQKIKKSRQELEGLEYKNDVYTYVRRALLLANEKINNSYTPVFAKKLSPLLSELTGGKYSDLSIDKEFNILVKSEGELHSLGYFSRGTADAVYFAVRMCMADILCDGAPLILDDPFWSFDGERLENAKNLIKKISESRQILLFGAR